MNRCLSRLATFSLTGSLLLLSAACTAKEPGDTVPGLEASVEYEGGSAFEESQDQPLAAPTLVEGSNEWIAWQALMGPDGEYSAAASYEAVLDSYGTVQPYARILEAELRHINALIRQLERFGITAPSNPYLGQLSAPDSLQEAALAWAEGEILNVEMYDELLARASDPNLIRVLTNLRRASLEEHLPQFEEAAANGGTLD